MWLVDFGGVRSIFEVWIYYWLNVDFLSKFNVIIIVLYWVSLMLELFILSKYNVRIIVLYWGYLYC